MKIWPILLIAGAALSACATPPANPWQGITVDTNPATRPLDCGSFPMPADYLGDGIAYDLAGVNALEAYRTCSEANETIAAAHAEQIGELRTATAALVEAGKSQRNIADMRAEMLEDERRHHFWQSIGYWILIGGAIAL